MLIRKLPNTSNDVVQYQTLPKLSIWRNQSQLDHRFVQSPYQLQSSKITIPSRNSKCVSNITLSYKSPSFDFTKFEAIVIEFCMENISKVTHFDSIYNPIHHYWINLVFSNNFEYSNTSRICISCFGFGIRHCYCVNFDLRNHFFDDD